MPTSRQQPGGPLALVVLICSGALLLPLAWPLFQQRVFVYNDLSWFHLPLRHLYQQALEKGDSLLWTPAIFNGLYFHGEGQTGVFHPLHLLLYRVLPLTSAFNLELLANYVGAFAGMWWLLRRLRFDTVPALFGAMLFAFSGFSLLHHHHINMVAVVAHLPWLLAAADVLIVGETTRGEAAGFRRGGADPRLASSSSAFPQAVWWNGLALLAFASGRIAETGRWRAAVPLAALWRWACSSAAIQVLPSADAIALSDRAALSPDFTLTYSLHPLNLLQLWSPRALIGGCVHRHRPPVVPRVRHLLRAPSCRSAWRGSGSVGGRWRIAARLITWTTVFAAIVLVLALGRYGGLAQVLGYLPVLGALRAPARYVVLLQFALAILATVAIEDLLAIRDQRAEPPAGASLAAVDPGAARRRHHGGAERAPAAVCAPRGGQRRGRRARCRSRSPSSRCWWSWPARRVRWALPALDPGHRSRPRPPMASASSTANRRNRSPG